MATGRNRPAPPRMNQPPASQMNYLMTHKKQMFLLIGGVIFTALFLIDLLAGILVKFI